MDASIDAAPVMLQFHPLMTKQCKTVEKFLNKTMSLLLAEDHFNGEAIVSRTIVPGLAGDNLLTSLSVF